MKIPKEMALRLNFTDVVRDDSLRNYYVNGKVTGYQFDVRLSYYRGHFLSVIDELGVTVDGKEVSPQDITFCLKGHEYGVAQLQSLVNVFWPITEPATIRVFQPGGLAKGDHDIQFTLYFRSPYMAVSDTDYMPINSCGQKVLTIKD